MSDNIEWDSNFTWRIENFSSCTCKIDETLKSPEFKVKSLRGRKWCLWIRPAGETNTKEYVSCYLAQIIENESDKECVIEYEISLLNADNEILKSYVSKNTKFENLPWGWTSFYEISRLSAEIKKCNEDTLIVRCRIRNREERKLVEKNARTRMNAEKYFLEWNITVFPNGMLDLGRHFFCLDDNFYKISLSMKEDDFEISICKITPTFLKSRPITGKLTLLDAKGNETLTKSETHTYHPKQEVETWIFPSLITKKQLQDTSDIYEVNKKITIWCEFSICKGMEEANCSNTYRKNVSNIEGLINLSHNFRNLLSEKSNSDVKLRVNGEEMLQAHRAVLVAQSPVFSAMFDKEMLENRTGIVDIKDVDLSTLESFLEFLYTGLVDSMDYVKATKLLLVADKYQVSTLKEVCVIFLISSFSNEKVCEVLLLASMVSHELLKIVCIDYIKENASEIFPSVEWADLVERNPKLSIDVIAYIGKNCKITTKHS